MPIKRYVEMIKRMDWMLFGAMGALAIGSVFFIYSAAYSVSGPTAVHHGRLPIYQMQMVWFGVGLLVYLTAALVDYRLICQWAMVWCAVAIGLLVLVLVTGRTFDGARRWLGWRYGFAIQPAEIAKVATLVAISYYLFHRSVDTRRQWSTVWVALVVAGAPLVLIMLEPDLGSALVLLPICFGLLFVAGARVKQLVLVIVLGLVLAPFAWLHLKDYQRDRLAVFASGQGPARGRMEPQPIQNLRGFGRVVGKRLFAGNAKPAGIFAEHRGAGRFSLQRDRRGRRIHRQSRDRVLYAVLLFSGLRIAANARDRLGTLLATGVVVMLFFHVFINVGMTIGLMPVTGLPLPLLSYGGSFVLASMTALGLLQNVWIHRRVY